MGGKRARSPLTRPWIETRILFSFGPLVVERALCARWKTRNGARVPPGISRAKPWSSWSLTRQPLPYRAAAAGFTTEISKRRPGTLLSVGRIKTFCMSYSLSVYLANRSCREVPWSATTLFPQTSYRSVLIGYPQWLLVSFLGLIMPRGHLRFLGQFPVGGF
jgi:hypothetical protein